MILTFKDLVLSLYPSRLSLGVLHTAVSFVFPTPLSAFACFILISEFVSVAIFWNFCRFSFSGFKIDVSKYWHVARFIKGIHSHAKPGQWMLSKVEELSKGSSCEISFFIIKSVAPSYHFVEHLEQLLIARLLLVCHKKWTRDMGRIRNPSYGMCSLRGGWVPTAQNKILQYLDSGNFPNHKIPGGAIRWL